MKLLITFVFTMACVVLHAQKFKFGKVSEEEILEKVHPTDPEASAAVLYKIGKITFQYQDGWKYVYDVEARIKIYNKEGYENATIKVPLYGLHSGNNEKFLNFKAYSYNIENGEEVKDRVKNSDIYDEELNEYWSLKKITFPSVREGSVLEYSYKIVSPYINSLPEFDFQAKIPVNFTEYSMEIPEYLGYKTYTKGFLTVNRVSNTSTKDFAFSYTPSTTIYSSVGSAQKTKYSTLSSTITKTIFSIENAPKVVQEEYMNNYKNYLTTVQPELEWIQMPNSTLENYSTSWDDIAKTIFNSKNFGDELSGNNFFKDEINTLLQDINNPNDKAIAIFEFVKSRMTWNEIYGVFKEKGVKNAYTEKTGNVADINLMLVSMMRYAKLNASPVLISTIDNGIPLFPTITGFNYVVCAVEVNGQTLLFDATSHNSTTNILPERTLNWFGRLLKNENESQQVDLMPNTPSRRIVSMEVNLNPKGSINGKYRKSLTDHYALRYRNKNVSKSEEVYIDELKKRFSNYQISNYEVQHKNDLYKPLTESFNFTKENAFDIIGGNLYINPLFFEVTNKNPFTTETRTFPIDFSFKKSHTYLITIKIPDGYKVDFIPESAAYQLPNNIGQFSYLISHTENAIQLRVTEDIKVALLPADYYKTLKEYYGSVVTKQTERIILTKI